MLSAFLLQANTTAAAATAPGGPLTGYWPVMIFLAVRHRPLGRGRLPPLAPPERPHHHRRHRDLEDGAGRAPGLRPDARAEVGHRDGRVRLDGRPLRLLLDDAGR